MLRKSGHIGSIKGTATLLKRKHITFFDYSDKEIPYLKFGRTTAASVFLNIRFLKTDASGFGRRTSHIRQPDHPSCCVVSILEDWIATTRDGYNATNDMALYHVPTIGEFNLDSIDRVMRETIAWVGVRGMQIKETSRSLRYCGATMMAAAGFPQYLIAHCGGWTADSKCLKLYAQPSKDTLQLVSQQMVTMAIKGCSSIFVMEAIVRSHAYNNNN